MKKILAVATMMTLLGSAVFAQDTGGDKKKASATKAVKAAKTEGAAQTKPLPPGPQSSTKKSSAASKVELNPQPLPPGAKKGSASAESKTALNPQPLPPGAKQPSAATAKTTSHKGTTAKSKKGSVDTGTKTPK